MNKLLPLLIFIISIISCQKDDYVNTKLQDCLILKESFPIPLLVNTNDTNINPSYYNYVYYEYNGDQLRKRVKQAANVFWLDGEYYSYPTRILLDSIIYDNNGFPSENYHYVSHSKIKHEYFSYSKNKLSRTDFEIRDLTTSEITTGFEEFYYNSSNRLVKSIYNTTEYSGKNEVFILTYEYKNNNVYQINTYVNSIDSINHISYETFEEYDTYNNPFKYLFFLKDLRKYSLSENNYLSRKYHYERNGSSSSKNLNFVYEEYNELGYPKMYRYGMLELSFIEYTCPN